MKKTDTRHTRKWAERRLARLASRILVNQWIPFLTCILKTQEEETTTNFKNIVPPSFLRRVRQNGPLQSASLEYPEGNHPLSFHVWTCTGKLGTWTERSMWGKARYPIAQLLWCAWSIGNERVWHKLIAMQEFELCYVDSEESWENQKKKHSMSKSVYPETHWLLCIGQKYKSEGNQRLGS